MKITAIYPRLQKDVNYWKFPFKEGGIPSLYDGFNIRIGTIVKGVTFYEVYEYVHRKSNEMTNEENYYENILKEIIWDRVQKFLSTHR